jgi:hypothetical protein
MRDRAAFCEVAVRRGKKQIICLLILYDLGSIQPPGGESFSLG